MKIDIGTVLNGLQVLSIGYKHTALTSYQVVTVRCLNCDKEFEKSYNTFKLGKTKCTCKGGYRRIKQ